jgi:hypothetical protein
MSRTVKPSTALLLAAAIAVLSTAARAQQGVRNGEWPNFGGDLGNTKYSPLVTYLVNGKQYIALTVRTGEVPEVVAFALP